MDMSYTVVIHDQDFVMTEVEYSDQHEAMRRVDAEREKEHSANLFRSLECVCGRWIAADNFTNTCYNCHRDYNQMGQLLADRSQWGEETGESLDEILVEYDPEDVF